MNISARTFTGVLAASVLLIGCQPDDTRTFDEPVTDATETAPPAMDVHDDQLGPQLEANMQRARAADVEGFRRMFPEHRDLVNAMLEECRQMMREMGITPPRTFTRVEQALEEDLQRIPTLGDAELAALKPEHLDRVQRVMDMRDDMMQDM